MRGKFALEKVLLQPILAAPLKKIARAAGEKQAHLHIHKGLIN